MAEARRQTKGEIVLARRARMSYTVLVGSAPGAARQRPVISPWRLYATASLFILPSVDRVCIFIDGSNFYHALKDAGLPVSVDLGRLSASLTGAHRRHVHTYYYNTPLIRPRRDDPQYEAKDERCRSQQRFFNALRFIPNVTFKPGRFQRLPTGGQVEKGVDVMLAIDMLTLAFKDRYDVAVLVSSDADYRHAIEVVKFETGKVVELRQVQGSRAYDLITAASVYEPITAEIINECLRRHRR
jgi:uncharacterized LabA/DUF88 family protein